MLAVAGGAGAQADTATAAFTVSTTVQASCSITAANLAFGTYTGAQVRATAPLTVTCTNTTPYTIGLNAGVGNGATITVRQMMGPGAATLAYQLFRDGGYTQNWGNTTGVDVAAGIGTGSAQTVTVYGQIGSGLAVTPGAYSDTITATLTY